MGYMDNVTSLPGIAKAGGAGAAFNPAMALGGLAGEAASAWYGNRMAQKRQHEAFDQQKYMMSNRYQMQTKDMMAAGLNPMLATSQGAPMPGGVGQAPTSKPDLVNAMANATLSSAQAAKTRQETENLKVENSNIMDAGVVLQKTQRKIDAEIDEISAREKVNKATEQEINRKTELILIQKELIRIQTELGTQELKIKTPEEIASGAEGAAQSATVSRILKPLIDILSGASGVYRNTK